MPRGNILRDARLAVSMLTVFPSGAEPPHEEATQAAAWFAWVGALVGAAGYAVVKIGELIGANERSPLVVAVIVLCLWAGMTRFLHWDGLADSADGYWGSDDPMRRLEIMADSSTGAFGVTAVTLTALLEAAAVAAVVGAGHARPLLLVPVVARFAATAAAWFGTPARDTGLGHSVANRPTIASILIAAIPLGSAFAALWLGYGAIGAGIGALGLGLALGVPHCLSWRFGGVTGDVMGASIVLTETALFVAFALVG